MEPTEEAYAANKNRVCERGEKLSHENRDIAPLPKVEKAARREVCRGDFTRFYKTCFVPRASG